MYDYNVRVITLERLFARSLNISTLTLELIKMERFEKKSFRIRKMVVLPRKEKIDDPIACDRCLLIAAVADFSSIDVA